MKSQKLSELHIDLLKLRNIPNCHYIQYALKHAMRNKSLYKKQHCTNQWVNAFSRAQNQLNAEQRIVFEEILGYTYARKHVYHVGLMRGACLAYIAYDDVDYIMHMELKYLRTYAGISDDPAAVLLLPLFEKYAHKQNESNASNTSSLESQLRVA